MLQAEVRELLYHELRDLAVNITLLTTDIGHGSKVKPARTCKDLMVVQPELRDGEDFSGLLKPS